MRFLRTNTAVRLTVGPFFDKTDGVTPETTLTVTSCKLTLMVDDANVPTLVLDTNPTASGGANDMVHVTGDDAGFYDLELAAANVNFLGRAMLALTDAATHCPVFHEFMILPAMIYDAMVLGTDVLHADVTQWLGTAAATPTVAGVPEVDLTHVAGATTNVAALATNADAIKAKTDALPSDPADASVVAGLIAAVETKVDTVDTVVDAIKAKTDNLPTDPADASVIAGRLDTLDTSVADLPTNAELTTALGTADDAVLAQVALVKAKTDALPSDPADQSLIIAATDAIVTAVSTRASQTSVDDLPTNAELATALGTADDAVLAAIAALNNLSSAGAQAAAAAALAAYSAATAANVSAVAAAVLAAATTNPIHANVKEVNDVEVGGTGVEGDEWGPA